MVVQAVRNGLTVYLQDVEVLFQGFLPHAAYYLSSLRD